MKSVKLLILLVLVVTPGYAQDFVQSYNFINTGTKSTSSFANTGITSFFISWSPQVTLVTCSVQVDSSADGISWGSGDLISSQNCATAGSSGTPVQLASGKNFVRINVTALTGNGGLNVTLRGWGGVGGGGVSAAYGPLAFSCANCKADVQYAFTVTCNNLSQTITTGANDPPFIAADVGKIIVGDTAGNQAPNCPPQGTITAFGGAHSVTVSNAATGTTTTGSLAWGTQDDGPNLQTAFAASLGKGCLYLPVGNMFFSVPPFIDARSTSATGYMACVIGQANTMLTPLSGFNYTSCSTNNACVFNAQQIANANPNYAYISDVTVFGLSYNLTGSGSTKNVFSFQRVTAKNVWVWGWGNGIGLAFNLAPPDSLFSIVSNTSGNTGMSCQGAGPTGGQVTIEQGYIGGGASGGGNALTVGGGCILVTSKLQVQSSTNGNLATVAAGNGNGGWYSYGDEIFQGFGTNDSIRLNSGTVSLHDDFVFGAASNTLGAIDCNGSGATFNLYNTTIAGGAGGIAIRSVSGCNVNNADGQSTVTQGTLSLSGNNFSTPRETQTGTCSTNAATVTFKLTPYINAPLVLVSDTTSASTGAQATSTNTTTATIHCNGASDTFVATVIPNPI